MTDKAKDFVKTMHGYNTTLMVFVKLLNAWSSLTCEERNQVIDDCKTNHQGIYHGMFSEE